MKQETDHYGRPIVRFKDLEVGDHFQIEPMMWGMVKIGWCRATYATIDSPRFIWPWTKVAVNKDPNDVVPASISGLSTAF